MYSFFSKEGDYAHYFVTVSSSCLPWERSQLLGSGRSAICLYLLSCRALRCSCYSAFPRVCLFVSVALRSSGRLPQKVSHSPGERLANHPGSARYKIYKQAFIHTHTCLTQTRAVLLSQKNAQREALSHA